MQSLPQHVEALIFASPRPIGLDEIRAVLEEMFAHPYTTEGLRQVVEEVRRRYDHADHSFELVEIAGGYQFMSKGAYHQTIGTHLRQQSTKKLSRSALETLSIIAYRQPVTRSELERIRGVNCDYALQKLLEKELVTITGRAESVGKPLLYGVTEKFMDYFGLRALTDLPQPKEFKLPDNTIGEAEDILVAADEATEGE
jgi:segregation and condensation protein B